MEVADSKPRKIKRGTTDLDRLYREYRERQGQKEKEKKQIAKETILKSSPATLHKRVERKRPSSADSVIRNNLNVESSYNLAMQLRMARLEEIKMQEAKRRITKEKLEKEREYKNRRRRLQNPVWENIQ